MLNFFFPQKLREISQKANIETQNLERLLRERQIELEACRKELEVLKTEKDHLEKKVHEVLILELLALALYHGHLEIA